MGKLEEYVRRKTAEKGQLLMTHQLLGYPDFDTNRRALELFIEKKVDLIELQIPFSDPVADGPLFLAANQKAIEQGTTVAGCMDFVEELLNTILKNKKTPILLMTYYNILFQYGTEKFLRKCKKMGILGLIVPDAPVEECPELFYRGKQLDISIIPIGTPVSTKERLRDLTKVGGGFLYYVPRKGVTGYKTEFGADILEQIQKVKKESFLPLAVGFGIQTRADVEKLKGISSIAVIGSELMRAVDRGGMEELNKLMCEIMEDL